ncbi:hypothetical protein Tcan_11618 [Toxocara canis]|uniref:Uncharacterized protein n=1 Tax=Toxocara canis TaxID=6265 RepID=A0A0B2VQI6_TOXCA|nr:hypothetical protein Tcan_11618 [Toxocara canis]
MMNDQNIHHNEYKYNACFAHQKIDKTREVSQHSEADKAHLPPWELRNEWACGSPTKLMIAVACTFYGVVCQEGKERENDARRRRVSVVESAEITPLV